MKDNDIFQHLMELIENQFAQLIEMRARCDGLEAALALVAYQSGQDPKSAVSHCRKVEAASLQKRLEKLSAHDPQGKAARFDLRELVPDLDPEFLKAVEIVYPDEKTPTE